SRDLEMIPSDLSDFNLYGGIYRYLNLVYVPALSIDKVFATASVDSQGKAGALNIKARFLNPVNIEASEVSITLADPKGKIVKQHTAKLNAMAEEMELWNTSIKRPALWSTADPALYTLTVSIVS